ncbi:hypothetical protein LLH23_02430 [bacterium]|nr:hypothetical protein [bacterium]
MAEMTRLWEQVGPEVRSFLWLTLAGVLGALATVALERRPIVPPRVRRGALHLGFAGTCIISLVAAHAVDHSFSTALVAAVCGGATLRRLKAQIDRGFEREHRRLDGEGDGT